MLNQAVMFHRPILKNAPFELCDTITLEFITQPKSIHYLCKGNHMTDYNRVLKTRGGDEGLHIISVFVCIPGHNIHACSMH